MDRDKRLERIDDFFNNISVEEFDEVLIRAGINEIKGSEEFGMELLNKAD